MLRNKKVLMLISLLVAIALWMYVMGSVDPTMEEKFVGVEIEMQGQNSLADVGLTARLVTPKSVTVTVEGKRSQVNKLKKKGLEAYIDVSTCDYGDNKTDIKIDFPDGVTGLTVENISSKTATFTVK